MGIVGSCARPEAASQKRPNIIFIMSDDHTTQGVGVYGSRLAKLNPTPTLDKIASEGIVFNNCFVTNSICTPSRACIITGQYSQANGVLDLEGHLSAERQYLPTELKKLGYQTAIIGKWHLHDEPAAFDYYAVLPAQGKYFDPSFRVRGDEAWPKNIINKQGHSTDVITDLTLDWFKETRKKDEPFFLMHHYKAPHDDFENAPRYESYLADTFIPEPESLYEYGNHGSIATRGANDSLTRFIGSSVSHRNIIRRQANHIYPGTDEDRAYGSLETFKNGDVKPFDHNAEERKYTSQVYQDYLKKYLRCVKGVDDNLARLFQYLQDEGLMDNTIIIYTGDQGFMLGEHDYIDKRWMYDESLRMPFIVRYPPAIKAGSRTNAIINNTDFAPTIIEMAGGKKPEYMQGNSFKYVLENEGEEPEGWQQSSYYRYWMHLAHRHQNPAHFGIRTKDYKLIFFYGKYWVDTDDPNADWNKDSWGNAFAIHTPASWEFYDLKNDPNEMNNAYGDLAYKEVIADLKEQLKAKRKELNEEDTNYPHIQKVIDEHWDD